MFAEEKNEEENEQQQEEETEESSAATDESGEESTTEDSKQEESEEAAADSENTKEADSSGDDEEEEVEVPEKFKELVEQIEQLSVLDLSELVTVLEKKFGVSAQPQVAAVGAADAGSGDGGGEEEEKSEFDVVLTDVGDQKIEVIKVVRDVTGQGLKDAKALVDSATSEEQVLREGVEKEEAEEMKGNFEEVGATVELR